MQTSKVSFGYQGGEVPCKITVLKNDGEAFEIGYEYDLGGAKLASALKGKFENGKLAGSYRARVVDSGDPVDGGTFELAAAK